MNSTGISINTQDMLEKVRSIVQPGLDRSYEIMKQTAAQASGNLADYLGQLVSRRGKRMRATFVLLIAQSNGQDLGEDNLERGALVAASIEMLHLATLVHDDIIDDSDLRRNESSAHKKWGTRVAVLVGDYALSKALELIIDDRERKISSSISRAASKLVAGEVLEIEYSNNINISIDDYYEVIYGKTASLWETCGECGGYLAGYDQELVKGCAKLGKELGLAFQIIDDLLDFGYGASNLGKATNSDLSNGLTTLPLILFYKNADDASRKQMESYLSGPLNQAGFDKIVKLLTESGSFNAAKEIAMDKIEVSIKFLKELPSTIFSESLIELCELMGFRSA